VAAALAVWAVVFDGGAAEGEGIVEFMIVGERRARRASKARRVSGGQVQWEWMKMARRRSGAQAEVKQTGDCRRQSGQRWHQVADG
jgi:hypothetical protein